MPPSHGKCTNSNCDRSLDESIEVAEGAPYKCPSCSQPLQSLDRAEDAVQGKTWPQGQSGRNPVRAKIVMGAAALIVLVAGWGVARWIQGNPRIELSATRVTFEFQQVGKGESSQEIEIKNVGESGTLDISKIHSTDPDFTTRKKEYVIKPGKSVKLEILFTPTVSGQHEATLTLVSDDQSQPEVKVQLSGTAGKLGPWWIWEQQEQSSKVFQNDT